MLPANTVHNDLQMDGSSQTNLSHQSMETISSMTTSTKTSVIEWNGEKFVKVAQPPPKKNKLQNLGTDERRSRARRNRGTHGG